MPVLVVTLKLVLGTLSFLFCIMITILILTIAWFLITEGAESLLTAWSIVCQWCTVYQNKARELLQLDRSQRMWWTVIVGLKLKLLTNNNQSTIDTLFPNEFVCVCVCVKVLFKKIIGRLVDNDNFFAALKIVSHLFVPVNVIYSSSFLIVSHGQMFPALFDEVTFEWPLPCRPTLNTCNAKINPYQSLCSFKDKKR